jgi:tripartite-type tricarboxylate transporter receptor subunit TctC
MIPNKLMAEAEADVLAGRIEIWIATVATSMRQMRAGKVKVLAVSGDRRASDLPNVPTVTEVGYPRANLVANYYIMAPAGTPKPIVDALNAEFVKAIGDKETRERLMVAGFEPTSSTADQAAALLKDEVARWEKIVRESGIRLE